MELQFSTFAEIIVAIKESLGIRKTAVLYRTAKQNGCTISQNSFNAYIRGSRCPSYVNAKLILDSLNYQIDSSTLETILNNTRNLVNRNESVDSIDMHLTLNSKFFETENLETLKSRIELAIKSENLETISQYVAFLIKNDLNAKGLLNQVKEKSNEN